MSWRPAAIPWTEPDPAGPRGEPVAVSADGRLRAVGKYQTAEIWDTARSTLLRTIAAHRRLVQAVAFSPDGRTLATRSFDDLALWDVESGAKLGEIAGLAGPTCSVAFSPDGGLLASGCDKAGAALWRVSDLTVAAWFPVGGFQLAAAFSPTGDRIAFAGQDETVRIWPVDGGGPVTLRGPVGWVDALAFGADGRSIAATSRGRVHHWTETPEPGPAFAVSPKAAEFIAGAVRLPWFTQLGRPSARDDTCVRLAGWDDCSPEPDEQQQGWADAIELEARTHGRAEVTGLVERARREVLAAARRAVPYDDAEDYYHLPNVCVWDAAETAATIAGFLALGWAVPAGLERRWTWFAAGHWPCGVDGTGRLRVF
ncbi:hypothetical protein ABT369_04895 [Dactylosporangium sp. NPDC000244]|uniref:WD40 repeat domain-containing protein n=1 Tax=Dactylosporangium sp. NPDC000244 TaxID=3154365 RepID=UPI003331E005